MSWLVDLAGKAESLLEKVDKTAANALQADKAVGSDVASRNENLTPQPSYVQGIEQNGREKENPSNTKGIAKTNVNNPNSKYRTAVSLSIKVLNVKTCKFYLSVKPCGL